MKVNSIIIRTIFLIVFIADVSVIAQTGDTLTTEMDTPRQIKLDTYVEQSRVPLNRSVVLHIEVSWQGELNRYQIEPVSQPILTNLLLEGSGSENRLEPLNDGEFRAVKAITYRFRPLEMGMAYIDGLVVRYKERLSGEENTLSSQRIMVEITDPLPEAKKSPFKSYVYIILLIIFFSVIIYFIILYLRKRRQARVLAEPEVPLAEIYLTRLSQEVDPRGTNLNEMITKLSKIFKEYLDEEFHIHTRELNTRELTKQLQELDIDPAEAEDLTGVFEKLDLIKFSGRSINPEEFIHIYGTIEKFLLKRKQLFYSVTDAEKEEQ